MRLALAQIDSTVADFDGNRARVLAAYRRACAEGADLVVTPELVLCGYPPLDLLARPDFIHGAEAALESLAAQIDGAPLIVGGIRRDETCSPHLRNAAFLLRNGRVEAHHDKRLLPTYDVFDEGRYFAPGATPTVWEIAGVRVGIAICEELWDPDRSRYSIDPIEELRARGVDLIVSPSASPYHAGKQEFRRALFRGRAEQSKTPIVVVNQVGANTELVFDGGSLAVTGGGVVHELPRFEETLQVLDPFVDPLAEQPEAMSAEARVAEITEALVLGIRGYFEKSGIDAAWIGLSGGIDSAVVAALATEALGAENVRGVLMPSRYSSEGSLADAHALADALGIEATVVPIEPAHEGLRTAIEKGRGAPPRGLADENLQARVRGTILMALSNEHGGAVLATGNKSEIGVGYCTLYGDMCGALAPIGDVTKGVVYAMARSPRFVDKIPRSTIEKPPSAELRPDQLDSDSLPDYDALDAVLVGYIEGRLGVEELVAAGHERPVVEAVVGKILFNEYKRAQAAPILRVSPTAFGIGRRVPLARRR